MLFQKIEQALHYLNTISLVHYSVIIFCLIAVLITVYDYRSSVESFLKKPFEIVGFGLVSWIAYELIHALSALEVLTLFVINPTELPHTVTLLAITLSVPVWILFFALYVKLTHVNLIIKHKKVNWMHYIGLSVIFISCFAIAYNIFHKLTGSQEQIKRLATYVDYAATKYLESPCAKKYKFDGYHILDTNTLSVYLYNKEKRITEFRIIRCDV